MDAVTFDDLIPPQPGAQAPRAPQPAQPVSFDDLIPATNPDGTKKPTGVLKTIDDYMGMAAKGLSFGLADRIGALGDTLTGRGSYDANLARNRATLNQIEADHPIAAPVTETVAGMAGPVGAIGAIGKGASLLQKAGAGALAGSAYGAVQGTADAPDWTNPADTAKHAGLGALGGAVVGGGLPVLARGVGAGYNALADAVRGGANGISSAAASHVLPAFTADDPQSIAAALQKFGPNGMLADTGPAMLGKAQGASLNSDEARSILASALAQRNQGTNARLQGDVNTALGPAITPSTVDAQLVAKQQATGPLYDKALGGVSQVDITPVTQQLARTQLYAKGTDAARLNQAAQLLQTQGPGGRMMPEYDPVALHRAKMELDAQIARTEAQTGSAANTATRDLVGVRSALNNAMGEQIPGYANANLAFGTAARAREALDEGGRVLSPTVWPQEQAAAFNALPIEGQAAYRIGARGEIEKQLGNKANDLVALSNVIKGEGDWNRAKLATTFGDEPATALINTVDREKQFRDTYNKVVENSQTAQRTAAASAMKPSPASETPLINPNMTLSGALGTIGKKAVGAALNSFRGDPTKSYGEVARILSAQGPQRDAYVSALADALARRQQNADLAPVIGNRAALAAALSADAYRRHLQAPR